MKSHDSVENEVNMWSPYSSTQSALMSCGPRTYHLGLCNEGKEKKRKREKKETNWNRKGRKREKGKRRREKREM